MHILIITDKEPVSSLWGKPFPLEGCVVLYSIEPTKTNIEACDVLIDLTFEEYINRIELYKTSGKIVFIASVTDTLSSLGAASAFIARFNNWPSFQERSKAEFAINKEYLQKLDALLKGWNIEYEVSVDTPGLISARIVAMIINEAFLAIEESVANETDIDTAMKLGTNYPKGPFEWCNEIGAKKIVTLLEQLAVINSSYTPATLLKQKAHEQ